MRANTDMPDLHWTIPVARWSSWPATAAVAPDIGFIEPMVRRRLSTLSRAALKVAHDCVPRQCEVRVVFASRHGELRRTTDILHALTAGEPVSPTAFSLSVLNAMPGIFSIARGDHAPASALSAGVETLGYALLEAHAQYAGDPCGPVLLVYADEPADAIYGPVEHEVQGGALAILLDSQAIGHLECTVCADESDQPDELASVALPTQSEAVLRCLERREPTAWHGPRAGWQWRWNGVAA
ncbi:Beta-ketoacyl synthase, N-terminal domain [Paraburkholderia megapolitana]|uniref:Beta-ketoacyl synthase, N-terminal domain n=2 Tax=Paraburkholderia megapolitana TaxID=420953 RepID=A0A1I3J4A9_9BURK|nr:Beta-ketoacyl synthase, N-terminal domain [Paraburkholderia megapolitana]